METANNLVFLHDLKTINYEATYAERVCYHTWQENNRKFDLFLFYQYPRKSMKIYRTDIHATGEAITLLHTTMCKLFSHNESCFLPSGNWA